MTLDSHQHFWNFDPVRDSWIDHTMKSIQRNFLPIDLKPELEKKGISGCIAVQADESINETQFLLSLANENPWIKGVVGWVDLHSPYLEHQLEKLKQEKKLVGFRKILQSLPPTAMEDSAFLNGIGLLSKYGFTYDILIYPKHLEAAFLFAKKFPDQKFVVDHLAKPDIKSGEYEFWSKGIQKLSDLPNVWCKVSGMVTEADWNNWKSHDFTPYLEHADHCFGTERLMYGSDWPVCLLAGTYSQVFDLAFEHYQSFSLHEKERIFGKNAQKFYGLQQ
ncbi:amidohydrolase family protein [Shivajiella indica]|uniref:Amidohydrolase family protein n=1 Tax=Shivajiella indica TaxID=872115 RepID=A0ABW5BEF9_9BACT